MDSKFNYFKECSNTLVFVLSYYSHCMLIFLDGMNHVLLHPQTMSKIQPLLTTFTAVILIQATILSHLDYCNDPK